MNATRTFLLVNTLVLISYGLYCLFVPSFLGTAAGIVAQTPTGLTELRAMYGGLQLGAGCLLLAGLLNPSYTVTALRTAVFLFAGLAIARTIGITLDSSMSAYTPSSPSSTKSSPPP